jgi:hypothetical protein
MTLCHTGRDVHSYCISTTLLTTTAAAQRASSPTTLRCSSAAAKAKVELSETEQCFTCCCRRYNCAHYAALTVVQQMVQYTCYKVGVRSWRCLTEHTAKLKHPPQWWHCVVATRALYCRVHVQRRCCSVDYHAAKYSRITVTSSRITVSMIE